MDTQALEQKVRELKRKAIKMLYKAQSGHPGSALSTMDVLAVLYFTDFLKYDLKHPEDPERDYFLMSNGHACPALYTVLAEAGFFPKKELQKLRQLGAGAQGHPHRGALPGIEISSGSLGQGLSVGIGLSYSLQLKKKSNRVVVMMSDGEQQEGSTWEAVMLAPKLKLNNLIAIVDKNKFQIDGSTEDVMPGLDPLAEKYRAFNWDVQEVDGHDLEAIAGALERADSVDVPAVIISHTVRGRGVSYMEGSDHWHAGAISEEQYQQAISDLTPSLSLEKERGK